MTRAEKIIRHLREQERSLKPAMWQADGSETKDYDHKDGLCDGAIAAYDTVLYLLGCEGEEIPVKRIQLMLWCFDPSIWDKDDEAVLRDFAAIVESEEQVNGTKEESD